MGKLSDGMALVLDTVKAWSLSSFPTFQPWRRSNSKSPRSMMISDIAPQKAKNTAETSHGNLRGTFRNKSEKRGTVFEFVPARGGQESGVVFPTWPTRRNVTPGIPFETHRRKASRLV